MNPPVVAGIDVGKQGALAVIDPNLGAFAYPMPISGKSIDWQHLAHLIRQHVDGRRAIAFVEKTAARPGQGVSSMHSFGISAGGVHGVLGAMAIPYVLISPQSWKRTVLKGTAKDKAAAIDFATRRYPTVDLRATPRSRKPSDGMADALCLAHYGLLTERGESAA